MSAPRPPVRIARIHRADIDRVEFTNTVGDHVAVSLWCAAKASEKDSAAAALKARGMDPDQLRVTMRSGPTLIILNGAWSAMFTGAWSEYQALIAREQLRLGAETAPVTEMLNG